MEKLEGKSNKFLDPGSTALVGPQELNPKPARKKSRKPTQFTCWNPPKSQGLVIPAGGGGGKEWGWGYVNEN